MIADAVPARKQVSKRHRTAVPEPRTFGEIAAALVARLAESAGPVLH